MRHLLLAACLALALPASANAAGNFEALTKTQAKMIAKLARRMEHNLVREHRRRDNGMFEEPSVTFDPAWVRKHRRLT